MKALTRGRVRLKSGRASMRHSILGNFLKRHVVRGSWTEKPHRTGPVLQLLGAPLMGRQFGRPPLPRSTVGAITAFTLFLNGARGYCTWDRSPKASIRQCSAFFMVQVSQPYMATVKNYSFDYTDFCRQSDVSAF